MVVCRQVLGKVCAAIVLCCLMAAPLLAQGITGTLTGTVKDAQGGVMPGATVTLKDEARGTISAPVVTSTTGDFVFPNLLASKYTVQVEMASFKTLQRPGVEVNPGARISLGVLTLEIGGMTDTTIVKSEAPLIQAATGERSFTVSTESVTNLPLAGRTYDQLLALAPGVNSQPGNLTPATRLGGGGDGNFMLDGATAMDPGVNRPATRVSTEAISEVRIVTSGYQAEYGRSSGLQINAVTKSGTNRFKGSLYDVERKSDWNRNSRVNILNGDPKATQNERDWGGSIGGPVGKPGAQNKLFFYANLEMNPRDVGGAVNRFRVPTALERAGDFSQTLDNLGNPYPYIKDPQLSGACSASSQVACFKDGGVLGRIPANRLYTAGINILKWWPSPTLPNAAGVAYNYESTDPAARLLGYQPIIRLDYQPTQNLRGSFKFVEYQQPNDTIIGTMPGFNDSKEDNYGIWVPGATINWTINNKTFLEAAYGGNYHHQEGCSVAGGSPNYCRGASPVNESANRVTAGFGSIPYLFPDATILDPNTFSYEVMQRSGGPIWDGTRVNAAPSFAWGGRVANAPPNWQGPFSNFILDTNVRTVNLSVTRVATTHTFKVGYYYFRSYQRRGQGNIYGAISFANDTNNALDTSFGFSNAAVGVFSNYSQLSRWGEGAYLAVNHEGFIQDNWRVRPNVTLDYGIRFVHQVPQYDDYGKASNFLPEEWSRAQAPVLYVAGCANGVYPCSGTNRQAQNPTTGAFLGANSALAIGTIVPGTGSSTNGVFANGNGIVKTNIKYPALKVAPRLGVAWDVKGNQTLVVRGSVGIFYDRPIANNLYNTVNNPPFSRQITVRYGQLQNLSTAGLTTEAPPALTTWQYDEPLPTSVQWNLGTQMVLPFKVALDLAYVGQHSNYFTQSNNINAIDYGTAFLASNQDRTVATSTVAGAASVAAQNPDLARFYRGYGTITQQQANQTRTYHSIQIGVNRRLAGGLALSFNDTIGLYDKQTIVPRLQHNADGTVTTRADQDQAQGLLGNNSPQRHVMRATFVWQSPKLEGGSTMKNVVSHALSDWTVAALWSGASGTPYSVGYSYAASGGNVNITGSPDFGGRVNITGDTGSGCSADPLKQFNTAAFSGPAVGSVGLESGANYLRGCFVTQTDMSLSRRIRLPKGVAAEFRLDAFNLFNQMAVLGRNTTMQMANPSTSTVTTNLAYDASGAVVASRSQPKNAGFGVATSYQAPRSMQMQLRISF